MNNNMKSALGLCLGAIFFNTILYADFIDEWKILGNY